MQRRRNITGNPGGIILTLQNRLATVTLKAICYLSDSVSQRNCGSASASFIVLCRTFASRYRSPMTIMNGIRNGALEIATMEYEM